jgi:LacI family kdg operon repressor
MKIVTAQVVADACGVSQPTFSRILGGTYAHLYNKGTCERVRETARKMGYRPNTAARAIVTGRFHAVGLVFRGQAISTGISLVNGVNDILNKANFSLVLSPVNNSDFPDETPAILSELSVDGLLISLMQDVQLEFQKKLEDQRLPVIWINAKLGRNCVYPDDLGITAEMVHRLVDTGHKKIVLMCEPLTESHHYSRGDRVQGYENAMKDAGLIPDIVQYASSNNIEGIDHTITTVLNPKRYDAVICMSETVVHKLLYLAALRGISVPEKLSVLAIKNTKKNLMAMNIGGVTVPFLEMGEEGARMLIKRLQTPGQLPPRCLPYKFDPGVTMGSRC